MQPYLRNRNDYEWLPRIGKEEEEEEKERVETTSRNTPSTHKYFNAQFPL